MPTFPTFTNYQSRAALDPASGGGGGGGTSGQPIGLLLALTKAS